MGRAFGGGAEEEAEEEEEGWAGQPMGPLWRGGEGSGLQFNARTEASSRFDSCSQMGGKAAGLNCKGNGLYLLVHWSPGPVSQREVKLGNVCMNMECAGVCVVCARTRSCARACARICVRA